MPRVKPCVRLLTYTLAPEEICAIAAKNCYSRKEIEMPYSTISKRPLQVAMGSGHESVIEHASFTFALSGVSRALLAQITRHRVASFCVQSQRYVSMESGFDYVMPPAIEALGEEACQNYARQMEKIGKWYKEWQEALGNAGEKSNEDARFVLPNACATQIVVTMNARELRHFFSLRCCDRAQWEIRDVACQMLKQCKEVAPGIFANAGPECMRTRCPEGAKSCGRPWKTRPEIIKDLNKEDKSNDIGEEQGGTKE